MPILNCKRLMLNCLRFLFVILAFGEIGCRNKFVENSVTNPGIEEPLDKDDLPDGWSFANKSGAYKLQASEKSHTGKRSLVLGGSGGEAEIETNPCAVLADSVVECEAWVQTDLFRSGEASVTLRTPDSGNGIDSSGVNVNTKKKGWQQIRFLRGIGIDANKLQATVVIRMSGEGLIHIDDVSLKTVPGLAPAGLVFDGGFEALEEGSESAEWKQKTKSKSSSVEVCKEAPHFGAKCIRVSGNAGWSVLVSRRSIVSKSSKIRAQCCVRVNEGKGMLKIDYMKGADCIKSTYSNEGKSDWTFVTVESDPVLSAQADTIHVTLAANNDTALYSVDFDDVEIFIAR